jgi:hypothetical protein
MSELPRMGDPDQVVDLPSWAEIQPAYRATWEERNATSGRIWTDVELAYQFAYEAYRNPRYRGRDFAAVAPELRRDWEAHHTVSPAWDEIEAEVRAMWDDPPRPMPA